MTQQPDPRNTLNEFAKMLNMQEMTDAIMAGRVSSRDVLPMLAGMIDGVHDNLFCPIVNAKAHKRFEYADHPMIGEITLQNGQKVRVTIEALGADGKLWQR